MYDEAVLGEVTSHEELAEYLTEYENDWYMGKDTDDDWAKAVINNKPNLFSLGRNPDDVSVIPSTYSKDRGLDCMQSLFFLILVTYFFLGQVNIKEEP